MSFQGYAPNPSIPGLQGVSPLALAMMSGQGGYGSQGQGGGDEALIAKMAQQMLGAGNSPFGQQTQSQNSPLSNDATIPGFAQQQNPPLLRMNTPSLGAPPGGPAGAPMNPMQPMPFRSLSAINPQALLARRPYQPPLAPPADAMQRAIQSY